MAGPIPDFSLPNSSFFNIYNDATVKPSSNSPNLPNGQCNFVDLSHGASGPKCGCRRFWSRSGLTARTDRRSSAGISPGYANGFTNGNAGGLTDDAAWCMCSHHACFHDDVRDSQPPLAIAANNDVVNNGQENERPRASREPLTPVMPELPFKIPAPTEPNTDFYTFNDVASFTNRLADQENALRGEVAAPVQEPSIPDTLSWTNLVQSNPDEAGLLPPIPSQCLMSSQPSSTTSSARMGYLRPFNGKGLGTLSGVRSKLREPLEPDDEIPQEDETVAPSMGHSMDDGQTVANTPRSTGRGDAVARQSPSPSGLHQEEFRQLSDTVHSHEQRLDRLENPSISAAGHDACDERHEHSDLRITELESRVEEVEKMINDSSSQISGHPRHPGINESIKSVASVSTVGSESVASRAELYSQLQALKSQLSQLQGLSSFPSYSRPWEVEVVFLPFPLKNVWVESHDFASQPLSSGINGEPDPWTQLPSSYSNMDPHSPDFGDWAGPDSESEWLFPRACAPNRTIEQRLRSRGLVKNVTVRNPDARSVHQAVSDAFGTLFRTFSRMQANVHHGSTQHHRVAKFLGLQSPWVPLRKIHKDARLRFLSPPEMVTPVIWDVPFLRSSVVMKATGVQRLFITHPEAYLQDQGAYDNGWNWQRLRELSRVYADSQSQNSQEVPEADAMEDCWTWNDTLDEHPASAVSSQSLSLRQAAQRNWRATSMSPAHRLLTSMTGASRASPSLGTNRSASRAKSPAVLRERKASRPPHIRTSSLPPTAQSFASPALIPAKRRVTSYVPQFERRASPQVRIGPSMGHITAVVKRRGTRSPSVRPRNTPRWSTSSPSPMPENYLHRATTPFYATPHSNAPFFEARPGRGGVVDDGESGSGTDQDGQGGEYMDEDEEDDSEKNDSPMLDFTHVGESQESWQDGQLLGPEDEPWPGIEDAENRDPDETIDIHVDDDAMSDAEDLENRSQRSSVPSEYPSTHRAWTGAEEAFRVYEDGDPIGNGLGVGK
ncbi:uncharacterized protein F4807DRAFT_324609 [Annulohypoxylon truncatum]|uniref:uncharacterized protein n=1 Tax=Annulohypoxylon truncatum TaxID=327061 RepID=UPI002007DF74|nr:uncharacterized protein F4807DRAFT_324609 [Annulohypoxylon truncatum]KAI1204674.1 hypothetical protein F4807DRAFT_324609 [Annulohypoxylon truncatum]